VAMSAYLPAMFFGLLGGVFADKPKTHDFHSITVKGN
jgi:hypothetical protein